MTIDFRRLSTTVDGASTRARDAGAAADPRNVDRLWFAAGFVFICAALAWLELRQPYYFAQDDNLAAALPSHLLGCRAFFSGHFPTYNPYQFLGSPLNTTGCSMLLYPFLYVSYALARWGLHNVNATDDVFCILHLVAGYGVCRLLARTIGLRSMTSTLVSTSFALSGFSLIAGRSWDNTTPLVVYLPLTFVLVIRLIRTPPDWKWLAQAACVLALFMNSGFVQLWLYAMLFAAAYLGIALLARQSTIRRLASIVPAVLIGMAFCTPLLLSFRQSTEGWTRGGTAEGPRIVWSNLLNMLLPSTLAPPISDGPQAFRWGSLHYQNMGELYNAGILLTAIGMLSSVIAVVLLASRPGRRQRLWRNCWGILGILAFLCGLGSQSFIWPLMRLLPLMRQMESPFKFAPFINLFLLMQGAVVLDAWLRRRVSSPGDSPPAPSPFQGEGWGEVTDSSSFPFREGPGVGPLSEERGGPKFHIPHSKFKISFTEAIVAAVAISLLCWHVSLCKPAFYTYGDHPYPKLPTAEASLLASDPGRILAIAPPRSIEPGFVSSLSNQWATVYDVPALLGYDPPIRELPSTARVFSQLSTAPDVALRAYGVRWIVVHRTALRPIFSANPLDRDLETVDPAYLPIYKAECYRRRPVLVTPDVLIFAVPDADPLAFDSVDNRPLPLHMDATGLDVDLNSPFWRRGAGGDVPSTRAVVVNFALRRGMTADIDGKPAPLGTDRWGRITAAVPAGAHHLGIRYTFAWTSAIAIGAALFTLGLFLAPLARRMTAKPRAQSDAGFTPST